MVHRYINVMPAALTISNLQGHKQGTYISALQRTGSTIALQVLICESAMVVGVGGIRGTVVARWTAVNRSSHQSCTRGMIHSKIHLIRND